jgi:lipopolysaccharide transport system permease protein
MSIYYVVFGLLLQRGTDNFVAFLLVGLTAWQWFANTAQHGMNSIWQNGSLMNQINVPKIVFPSVVIVMDLVKSAFVFSMLFVFVWLYGYEVNIKYCALPFVMIVEFILIIAFTYLLASIVPFFPDMRFLFDAILNIVIFMSGVFFSGSSIPQIYQKIFYFNPMVTIIEAYRTIILYNEWPDINKLMHIGVMGIFGIYITQAIIDYFDHHYPRIAK